MKPQITKKHAVGLARMTNSFYDPDCGANLFKSSPVYQFNHQPTIAIKDAVKSGALIDIVGNILGVEDAKAGEVDLKAFEAQVRANVEKELTAKHEAEIEKLKADHAAEIEKLKTVAPAEKADAKSEKVEEADSKEVDSKEDAKAAKKK